MPSVKVLKGQIIYSADPSDLVMLENGYLVFEGGFVRGAYGELPEQYAAAPCADYGERLIIPGLCDLHLHAPQYAFRGLGGDLTLLPWLQEYAYPEEARYADPAYAEPAYRRFAAALTGGFTTRACVYATCHSEASLLLAELLEQSGVVTYVGRVSMDRLAPDALREDGRAAENERRWLEEMLRRGYQRTRPIVTPRFAPGCSAELLAALGRLAAAYALPVQSHLSENMAEIELVQSMYPDSSCYGEVYDNYGLFGQQPTVMAHCVHSGDTELGLMRERGVFAAHCPASNINLRSGAAPARKMLYSGINIGLGTDVAGGAHLSLFRAMQDAIAVSKLRCALAAPDEQPLTLAEAFYLATSGGGAFFGQAGGFHPGYAADALVLDDTCLEPGRTLYERLQRAVYLLDESNISAKYVAGAPLRL